MEFLKRSLAPITEEAWSEIEDEVRRTLLAHLTARRVVDVDGPLGWETSAVDLGRLHTPTATNGRGVGYGIRRVLPLVETRREFELDIWEMDDVSRGAEDADLEEAITAAKEIADFEERAIIKGFEAGDIRGIVQSVPHPPVVVTGDAEGCIDGLSRGLMLLVEAGIKGPYALLAGPQVYRALASASTGYPPMRQAREIIGGAIHFSNVVDGGILLSQRGEDFRLTLGQDLAIGFQQHDTDRVRLYLTESFVFRVLTPEAAVVLQLRA